MGNPRRGELDRHAEDADLAAVRLDDAAHDLHQGRLAGAVVADEGDDLAAMDLHARAAQRLDVAEVLVDPVGLDDGRRGHAADGLGQVGRGGRGNRCARELELRRAVLGRQVEEPARDDVHPVLEQGLGEAAVGSRVRREPGRVRGDRVGRRRTRTSCRLLRFTWSGSPAACDSSRRIAASSRAFASSGRVDLVPVLLEPRDRGERRGGADRVRVERADVRHPPVGDDLHHRRVPAHGRDGEPGAERLSEHGEVGDDAVVLLRAAEREAVARDHLVEDEDGCRWHAVSSRTRSR